MGWLRKWWGGFLDEVPPRRSVPVVVWDDDDWTDKTEPSGEPAPRIVEFRAPIAAPRGERPRVKPVVVRVTLAEWRALGREARGNEDLGDVLRRWAELPPLKR